MRFKIFLWVFVFVFLISLVSFVYADGWTADRGNGECGSGQAMSNYDCTGSCGSDDSRAYCKSLPAGITTGGRVLSSESATPTCPAGYVATGFDCTNSCDTSQMKLICRRLNNANFGNQWWTANSEGQHNCGNDFINKFDCTGDCSDRTMKAGCVSVSAAAPPCKSTGQSCSGAGQGNCCSNLYCVHGTCRTTSTYCGDNYCDAVENCPADNILCTDNKCYEPTCTNGCGQTAVATGSTDEACTATGGCSSPPCECDGAGNCVGGCKSNTESCTSDSQCCSDNCADDFDSGKFCCASEKCGHNGVCYNQATLPYDFGGNNIYYCKNGNWEYALGLKYDWDRSKSKTGLGGNCYKSVPSDSWVQEGYFPNMIDYGDHYCEKGNWTTRTKFVALQLLNLIGSEAAGNNYVLFCDDYEKALNYYPFSYTGGALGAIDKVCVLRLRPESNEKVVLGAPLAYSLGNPTTNNFMSLINATCQNQSLSSCPGSGNKIWYDNITQSVYFSIDPIQLTSINFWQKFLNFLKNPFDAIFNMIINVIKPSSGLLPIDYDFIKNTEKFDKVYLARKDGKSVMGVAEKINQSRYLAVYYNGFNSNICAAVNNYENPNLWVNCSKVDSSYYATMKQKPGYVTEFPAWRDLTAKLRLK